MYKFYKHRLYKKYQDELWGHVISKKSFSYNKRSVLLNYRDTTLKNRLRIKTKFKYFRRGFLKNLNYTLLLFRFFRKNIRVFTFKTRQCFITALSSSSKSFKNKRKGLFRSSRISSLLKFNIFCLETVNSNKIPIKPSSRLSYFSNIHLYSKTFNFPVITTDRRLVFYKSRNFLRVNNLQFVIKKKLNLRKQKIFFYSVHIAAPKKKTKK